MTLHRAARALRTAIASCGACALPMMAWGQPAQTLYIGADILTLEGVAPHYAQAGVTTAADHLIMEERLPIMEQAARDKQFFIDVVAAPAFIYADKVVGTGRIRWGEYDNHLKWGGLKIAVDGSPQGKTAFVSQSYLTPVPGCEKDCKGFPNLNQQQVEGLYGSPTHTVCSCTRTVMAMRRST